MHQESLDRKRQNPNQTGLSLKPNVLAQMTLKKKKGNQPKKQNNNSAKLDLEGT